MIVDKNRQFLQISDGMPPLLTCSQGEDGVDEPEDDQGGEARPRRQADHGESLQDIMRLIHKVFYIL